MRIQTKAKHKIFATMKKEIDFTVIDQMFSAQLSMNQSKEEMDALRPQVKEAIRELLRQEGKPSDFTGVITYHGIKIRIQRPTSYTWELNTQLKDENLDYYKRQHEMYEQLQDDLKDLRRDMKRTAEKLAKAHPNSESIKHDMTIAFM